MITRSVATVDSLTWQEQLATSIRDPKQLLNMLGLDTSLLDGALNAHEDFPLRVPLPYLQRIAKGDPNDPLLRQVLPLGSELLVAPGYSDDPLDEQNSNPVPGLVHKYHGRVLLIVSPNCAINCRYCFRRHFPYQDNKPGRSEWQHALDYIANNSSIREVIYSGGDPLATSDKQLQWLTEQVASIKHVQRLRVHTRLPIVIPNRITDSCLQWLTSTRLIPSMVIHSNHPNELDKEVATVVGAQGVTRAGVDRDACAICAAATVRTIPDDLHATGIWALSCRRPADIDRTARCDIIKCAANKLQISSLIRRPGAGPA